MNLKALFPIVAATLVGLGGCSVVPHDRVSDYFILCSSRVPAEVILDNARGDHYRIDFPNGSPDFALIHGNIKLSGGSVSFDTYYQYDKYHPLGITPTKVAGIEHVRHSVTHGDYVSTPSGAELASDAVRPLLAAKEAVFYSGDSIQNYQVCGRTIQGPGF